MLKLICICICVLFLFGCSKKHDTYCVITETIKDNRKVTTIKKPVYGTVNFMKFPEIVYTMK